MNGLYLATSVHGLPHKCDGCLQRRKLRRKIVDIEGERARKVAKGVEAIGQKVLAPQADVADAQACARMIDTTMEKFGHLDVLFCNAGIGGGDTHLKDLPSETFKQFLFISLISVSPSPPA